MTVAPPNEPRQRAERPSHVFRRACGYAILPFSGSCPDAVGQRSEMRQPVGIIPYEALQQPLSPLFLDYLAGREKAGGFLPGDGFELAAIASAAERTRGLERPMAAVAEALARQQQARGSAGRGRTGASAREPGGDRRGHGPAGRPLRRAAVRPVEGTRHGGGGPAPRGGARPARGAGVLGGLGRPRLRGSARDHHRRRFRRAAHAALRPAAGAARAAGLGHRARRRRGRAGRGAGAGAARSTRPRRDAGARGLLLPRR